MMNPISGAGQPLNTDVAGLGAGQTAQQVNAPKTDAASSKAAESRLKPFEGETVNISDAAKQKADAEREVMAFAREAQRLDEPMDADKVSRFKNLVDSGRISDYLRDLNTDDLVSSLLGSPVGAALAQAARR